MSLVISMPSLRVASLKLMRTDVVVVSQALPCYAGPLAAVSGVSPERKVPRAVNQTCYAVVGRSWDQEIVLILSVPHHTCRLTVDCENVKHQF